MSKSLNELNEGEDYFIKTYGSKKPLWQYFIRKKLNNIGIKQPVEYYDIKNRLSFEKSTLLLWEKYGLNVPKIIKVKNNNLFLSKISGQTLQKLSDKGFLSTDILKTLFLELNSRHSLALKNNEPKLAHIDANLRNILLCDNKIYHIDFEMGREYEHTNKWLERELSKLLISILDKQNIEDRKETIILFLKIYTHKHILKMLFKSKLKNKSYFHKKDIDKTKYSLKNIIFEFQTFAPLDFLNIMTSEKKNILVVYSARYGDILMSTPTLRAIKETWRDSDITFLTHPNRMEILEKTPLISKLGYITNKSFLLTNFLNKKYDLAFIINKDNINFVKYGLNSAVYTMAFSSENKKVNNRLFYHVPYPKQHSLHSVDMRLSLLKPLNIQPSTKKLEYVVDNEEENWAKKYLNNKNLNDKFLLGIQANSFHTKAYRNWPIENFTSLCLKILQKKKNAHFLLFGSNDDIKNLKDIEVELKENCSLLAGTLTLRETASIMNEINLYIGVDTGPTHIMGTFNVPMIVLYHSFNSSKLLQPLENENFIAIDHPDKGLGSLEPSMSDISVNIVFEKAINFL